jgi:uncharacterized protein
MVQVVVLTATVVAVACVAGASTKAIYPAPPPPGRIISDAAGLIDKEDGAEIERLGAALLAEKGYPVAVVTIRSLAGQGVEYPIDRYALELMQSWRHEERFRTYGMLLLVAAGDRKARIQLGSAWGGAHDDRARRIMDRMILPEFRDGDLSSGILAGVRGFDAMGRQVALPQVDGQWWMPSGLELELGAGDQPWWLLPAAGAAVVLFIVGLISVARSGRKSWAWAAAAFVLAIFVSRVVSAARGGGGDSGGGATGEW